MGNIIYILLINKEYWIRYVNCNVTERQDGAKIKVFSAFHHDNAI